MSDGEIFLDYEIPGEAVSQEPAGHRVGARLMVLDRSRGTTADSCFEKLPDHLEEGDLLVLNDTRVVPALVRGVKADTGGKVEILFLEWKGPRWRGLARGRIREGTRLKVEGWPGELKVLDAGKGMVEIEAPVEGDAMDFFSRTGRPPLPPYIRRGEDDPRTEMDARRYQTVYARSDGSVAAPTAGLHFDRPMLRRLKASGKNTVFITLHVGWGTFKPVRGDYREHRLDPEWGSVTPETAEEINLALKEDRRIVAVGTTTVRLLESRWREGEGVRPGSGWVDLLVTPGYDFRVVGAMLTNFHRPRSSLLLLVDALAGSKFIEKAYFEARRLGYRFFSYGDAMLIL